MNLHLKITGVLFIILACIHVFFPNYFNWKKEMALVSLINRQLMYVHTFFIALAVLLMGIFCITETEQIITTNLGHKVAFGLFIFWLIRLFFQLFIYSPKLWKGRLFETVIHLLFTALWMYICIVFFLIYWL